MGLWPFGRTKADVETTSRVVVLRARDAVALRAKVTVKFEEPQTQAVADQVLEGCQDILRAVVREAPSGASVLGFDAAIANEVFGRLSPEPAVVRSVEIAGLHIVGDPGHLAQPTAGPESNPSWLHAQPTPASSDRPGEHPHDRPTPAHGFAPFKGPGDRPTPIHGFPPFKGPGDRPTPVQGVPPFKAPADRPATTTPPGPRGLTPDGASPATPERGPDRPTPTRAAPGPKALANDAPKTAAHEPATKPSANETATKAPANEPANAPAREGQKADVPPQRPRDPFAATTQSAQPPPKPTGAPAPLAQPHDPAPSAPAPTMPAIAAAKAPSPTSPPATEARAQTHVAHAPTMPAIAAQVPVREMPAVARLAVGPDGAPATAPSEKPPTSPRAAPLQTSAGTTQASMVAGAGASGNTGQHSVGTPSPSGGRAPAPIDRPHAASPGVYSAIGLAEPTPAPGAVRPRDPHAATRPDLHTVRGRAGSTFPPPPTSVRASRLPDEPSSSSRSYGLGGPPSTGRTSRTPDEPSASSRSYAYLAAQSAGARNGPPSRTSNRPPPAAVAARRRVVASRLLLPMGAGPYEVARGLTPVFRDTAGRILVAFLRTYDLTVIRRVPFDAVESDILSSLTAPSDGAPGTYTASHATEIHRWREAFGATKLDRLQREANLAAAALAHEMFTAEAVPSSMTAAVVEGLAGSAFGDPDMLLDIGRYLYPARETTSAEALANMIELAGEEMPPGLEGALDPLFTSLREEVAAVAEIAKEVMLTPG